MCPAGTLMVAVHAVGQTVVMEDDPDLPDGHPRVVANVWEIVKKQDVDIIVNGVRVGTYMDVGRSLQINQDLVVQNDQIIWKGVHGWNCLDEAELGSVSKAFFFRPFFGQNYEIPVDHYQIP